MKTINVEIWKSEKFYIAKCLEYSNCFTQGKTIEETIRNIKEVIYLILNIKKPKLNIILKDSLVEAL
ncbi:MAG: type II toxin-antitoxin system HicB family antitoxin [Candidatus Jettenia sp.]|uniref:HicB-like antitoxin of toxin-antitoxin system domain-containing protein n=1 Tax=Candidatus Jettenia caeni TaxID=247490 RepID=I3IN34_9BACT|nr:type II toxin-antitoxin system HicB family antitoxin [Candidatus Jettenia sp. AMX1]MBC6928011.1 type II toxin-antitoxin system HicB family antitoxin [Candidatus Jettenia sp.]NUN24679.1 type II toxin-antitoxin system HicB family antitoxin [Candidatus Jettenia caeni]KAA0251111.1 MAG: type II toxin-antitoxin system HicB family antitoxin [Candidatus Jettenia sp. AMX1]MCQ3927426.1 type II toxin-antitoxin system HicB family antitoxin [Candidatus Jettenia sp.]MDL1937973.1 type II toxin-antitoxin s